MSQIFDDDVAGRILKVARRLEVQLKPQMLGGSNAISICGVLPAFQMACGTNGYHERAPMCLFHYFIKNLLEPPQMRAHVCTVQFEHVNKVR